MRDLVWKLAFLLAISELSCFRSKLPPLFACGPAGECPESRRCEAALGFCVPLDTPTVSGIRFSELPEPASAAVKIAPIQVELFGPNGERVRLSGAPATLSLEPGPHGAQITGDATSLLGDGIASFDNISYDRPDRGVRVLATIGKLSVKSAPIDIGATPPLISVLEPPSNAEGCIEIPYHAIQAQGLPLDVLVEVDPDGPEGPAAFRRATQGPSALGRMGVQGAPSSPEGLDLSFTWNSSRDLPTSSSEVSLRFTASAAGVAGSPVTSGTFEVHNGPRWTSNSSLEPGLSSVKIDDIDRDGWPDTITTSGSSVRIRGPRWGNLEIPLPFEANDSAVGDFNADGRIDLVVATRGGGLQFLYQQAAPQRSFEPGDASSDGTTVKQVIPLDFDHDGHVDLVSVNGDSGAVSILRQSRDGHFDVVEAWQGPTEKAALLDSPTAFHTSLIVTQPTGDVMEIPLDQGIAGHPKRINGLAGQELATAHLDFSGLASIAALGPTGLSLSGGSFNLNSFPSITGSSLSLADIDDDTHPEVLAVSDGQLAYHKVFFGQNHSIQVGPPHAIGDYSPKVQVQVADLNRDGREDILVADLGAATLTTMTSATPRACASRLGGPFGDPYSLPWTMSTPGGGQGTAPPIWFAYPGRFLLGNLDGDGKIDVLINPQGQAPGLFLLHGRGDGSFEPAHPVQPTGGLIPDVALRDMDGDGLDDIVYIEIDGNVSTIYVLYNLKASPGSFLKVPVAAPPDVLALAVADLNEDGAQDLVTVTEKKLLAYTGQVRTHVFSAPVELSWPGTEPIDDCEEGVCWVRIDDLNEDGAPEIELMLPSDLYVFPNQPQAPGHMLSPVNAAAGKYSTLLAVGDIVGDRRKEIIVDGIDGGGTKRLVKAYDLGTFNVLGLAWSTDEHNDEGFSDDSLSGALADINADGKTDLVLSLDEEPSLISLTPRDVVPGSPLPRDHLLPAGGFTQELLFADLDADGLEDLISASGAGLFVAPGRRLDSYVGSVGRGSPILIADLAQDRWPEILDVGDSELCHYMESLGRCMLEQLPALVGTIALPADIDRNGRPDILMDSATGQKAYLNFTTVANANMTLQGVCTQDGVPVDSGDLDGDGAIDLITLNGANLQWVAAPANACSVPRLIYSVDGLPQNTLPALARAIDMNLDGRLDIVTVSKDIEVAIQSETPGVFDLPKLYGEEPSSYRDAVIADINRDGRPDVFAVRADSTIIWFYNDLSRPGTLVNVASIHSSIPEIRHIAIGDVDGDGWLDLVTESGYASEVLLHIPETPGAFHHAYNTTSTGDDSNFPSDTYPGRLLDFDSDGKLDFIVQYPYPDGTFVIRGL